MKKSLRVLTGVIVLAIATTFATRASAAGDDDRGMGLMSCKEVLAMFAIEEPQPYSAVQTWHYGVAKWIDGYLSATVATVSMYDMKAAHMLADGLDKAHLSGLGILARVQSYCPKNPNKTIRDLVLSILREAYSE